MASAASNRRAVLTIAVKTNLGGLAHDARRFKAPCLLLEARGNTNKAAIAGFSLPTGVASPMQPPMVN